MSHSRSKNCLKVRNEPHNHSSATETVHVLHVWFQWTSQRVINTIRQFPGLVDPWLNFVWLLLLSQTWINLTRPFIMVVLRSAKPALFLYFWLGYALYTPATLTLALGAIDTNQSVVNTSPPRLSCHMCESFIDDDECVHLAPNSSTFSTPCKDNQISCTVSDRLKTHHPFDSKMKYLNFMKSRSRGILLQ